MRVKGAFSLRTASGRADDGLTSGSLLQRAFDERPTGDGIIRREEAGPPQHPFNPVTVAEKYIHT